jgi:hypothetical protein
MAAAAASASYSYFFCDPDSTGAIIRVVMIQAGQAMILKGPQIWFTRALATRAQSSRPLPSGAGEGQVKTTDHLANDLACLER